MEPTRFLLMCRQSGLYLYRGTNFGAEDLTVTGAQNHVHSILAQGKMAALVLVDFYKQTALQTNWVFLAKELNLPTFTVTHIETGMYSNVLDMIDHPEVLIRSCGGSVIRRVR